MKQNGVMSEIGRDADEGQGETKQKQISKEWIFIEMITHPSGFALIF